MELSAGSFTSFNPSSRALTDFTTLHCSVLAQRGTRCFTMLARSQNLSDTVREVYQHLEGPNNTARLTFWNGSLRAGRRITGVAGTDSHGAFEGRPQPSRNPRGHPARAGVHLARAGVAFHGAHRRAKRRHGRFAAQQSTREARDRCEQARASSPCAGHEKRFVLRAPRRSRLGGRIVARCSRRAIHARVLPRRGLRL